MSACIEQTSPDALDLPTLHKGVASLRERPMSANGASVYIHVANSFQTWLHEHGHVATHLRIRQMRAERRTIRTLTDAQISQLLKPRPRDYSEWRTRALVWLLADTGVRVREALTLRLDAVDMQEQLLRVMGKGRRERVAPFGDACAAALKQFLAARRREGIEAPVFLASRTHQERVHAGGNTTAYGCLLYGKGPRGVLSGISLSRCTTNT